jgi:diguanylate cyclase (GGDEF)-like protein
MKRLGVSLGFLLLFLVGLALEPYVIQLGDPVVLAMFLFTPVLTIFAGVMSFRYGRTGVSFFLILIALLYGIYLMPGGIVREPGFLQLLRLSLLLLIPILIFYFALSPDKGFNSLSGRVGLVLLISGIISAWMFLTIPELGALISTEIEQISQFPLLTRLEQVVNRDVPGALVLLWIGSFVILFLASIFGRRGGFWLAPWPYILLTFGAGISRLVETTVLLFWLNLGIFFVLLILINEGWTFAFLDPLTNIPNRRYLEMYLQRLGGEGMVAMADIDHFKQFNDTYGHETGDQVLKMTARVLGQEAKGFRVFRYGGEEFTLIGKGLEPALAKQTLEETRKALELRQFYVRKKKKPVTVTVSIGLVGYDKNQPAKVALEHADNALYKAKKNGRNQVYAPMRKKVSTKP